MSQKRHHVALDSSGIVLSLPIVNVKGTPVCQGEVRHLV